MQYLTTRRLLASCLLTLGAVLASAQNSIMVNFGSTTCTNAAQPNFSLIKNPLSASPVVLTNCDMAAQLPDYFSVFIAYNPKDNNLYIADIRNFAQTKTWKLDIGLPGSIACPPSIPTTPTFTHNYVSNNYEFDNNGDLWSFSNYNPTTGQCMMDKYDVTTGTIINSRVLQFPAGNFPDAITTGDLTILPNGRMFATLGSAPSRLYEIFNYSGTSTATASFLTALPAQCFGIAYLGGRLAITGSNLVNNCYYFDYEISTNTLSAQKPFMNGQSPIDNTSITPALGTTKQLLQANTVDAGTADLTYEIYVRNMGNVVLNEINVTESLADAFGAANVSNVSVEFVPGANAAGLTLNPLYNGTTVTSMLNSNQSLPNQTQNNTNYFFKVLLKCRVSNLQAGTTYLNSAIGRATINNAIDQINIADSSNNGPSTVVDPNNDGNATGVGENVPTPFNMSALPVKFLGIKASWMGKQEAKVEWEVATPVQRAKNFEVQYGTDAHNWRALGELAITDAARRSYQFEHVPATGTIQHYYRVKQQDIDGIAVFSPVAVLSRDATENGITLYPNPAKGNVWMQVKEDRTQVMIADAAGRIVWSNTMAAGSQMISIAQLPSGTYTLVQQGKKGRTAQRLVIMH